MKPATIHGLVLLLSCWALNAQKKVDDVLKNLDAKSTT
jgi:hypothetical protein